jgi:hypothetical protein
MSDAEIKRFVEDRLYELERKLRAEMGKPVAAVRNTGNSGGLVGPVSVDQEEGSIVYIGNN